MVSSKSLKKVNSSPFGTSGSQGTHRKSAKSRPTTRRESKSTLSETDANPFAFGQFVLSSV